MIPNNACPSRITAAAGTKLAGASSLNKVTILLSERILQPIYKLKKLINLFCFPHSRSITGSRFRALSKIPHCWLKSLGLVSVPVWLIILSDQLRIIGLVSFYLPNNLILYKLILKQHLAFFIIAAKHSFKNTIILIFKADSYILLTCPPCFSTFN